MNETKSTYTYAHRKTYVKNKRKRNEHARIMARFYRRVARIALDNKLIPDDKLPLKE